MFRKSISLSLLFWAIPLLASCAGMTSTAPFRPAPDTRADLIERVKQDPEVLAATGEIREADVGGTETYTGGFFIAPLWRTEDRTYQARIDGERGPHYVNVRIRDGKRFFFPVHSVKIGEPKPVPPAEAEMPSPM
jgi:hypothetical protein